MTHHPVVIIGGGPAGLTAGYELLKRGIKPIVLEKADSCLILLSYLRAKLRARLNPDFEPETFEEWVIDCFGRRLYRIFFKTYTEKVWGIPCTQIRADWAAQRIQNMSLKRAVINAVFGSQNAKSLIKEFKYPILGPGMMWERCQEILRVSTRSCPYLPFWSRLRNTGKRVTTFDVPKTYPIEGLEGIQVSAWGEEYPLIESCSLPANFISELSSRFGNYHHPREILNPRLISQQVRRYQTLMSNIQQKLQAVQFVMNAGEWDLFMTSFGEAHYGNHLFYHLFNQDHWAYDPQVSTQLSDALPNIYGELDNALKTLLQDVSDHVTVFVISVHGVDTNYSANHLMPLVLEKLGFQAKPKAKQNQSNFSVQKLIQGLKSLIPMPVRDFINDWILPQHFHDKMHSQQFISSIDWCNTKAFFLPIGHFQGFISINLKGRDPYGVVEPGAEYEQICQQITDELKRLVNPETGKPAVANVIKTHQLLQGENIHKLPDLIIQWAEDAPINQLEHPDFGLVSGTYYGLRKTQHTGNGFLIATGSKINPASTLTDVKAVDLAPTLLYLMGQEIPDYMEGKVLLDLIDEGFKKNNDVKYKNKTLVLNK
ncbi:alkaline phosphatase family protein [Coleofasciculus sp. F4-SAH-05]|uniref:alkaline phosphatase family protein n=1 Tax=Coleofasciculus sp. F4-SAH-05 TaxID=3069525 RepID=UPI004063BD2D